MYTHDSRAILLAGPKKRKAVFIYVQISFKQVHRLFNIIQYFYRLLDIF